MTASLIDALQHPGAAFLLELVEGPMMEADLIGHVPGVSQSTSNRRLARLEELGLITRTVALKKTPGRQWQLTCHAATRALLTGALEFGALLAEHDKALREDAMRKLARDGLKQGTVLRIDRRRV